MEKELYDVIIIGGGPAGLTAAIYAARRALKTLVLSSDIGGQISKSSSVENYPGIDQTNGINLAMSFFKQAKKFGAKILFEEVKKITPEKEIFSVATNANAYSTRSVILASGKKPRQLGVPGEEEFLGKGVTYCATCDAPFFKDKNVVVAGGGNSALDAALLCTSFAKQVYLIHRSPEFRAEQIMIDKIKGNKKICVLLSSEIREIRGESKVESIILSNDQKIDTDGVIIEVGFMVDRSILEGLVETDNLGQIITGTTQTTSAPGIFAAGDITQTPYKQVVISAGEGAKAALAAFDYVQKLSGKKGIVADWH